MVLIFVIDDFVIFDSVFFFDSIIYDSWFCALVMVLASCYLACCYLCRSFVTSFLPLCDDAVRADIHNVKYGNVDCAWLLNGDNGHIATVLDISHYSFHPHRCAIELLADQTDAALWHLKKNECEEQTSYSQSRYCH